MTYAIDEAVRCLTRPDSSGRNDIAGVGVLVFCIDGREHGVAVEDVVEVLRMVASTPLPEAPPWLGGVINFRGRVIPLIDVSSRLGAPTRPRDLSTRIIVVLADESPVGLIVDDVVEVLTLPAEAVDAARPGADAVPAVSGVARDGDRIILLVDRGRLCEGSVGFQRSLALGGPRAGC